ncbi:MAG TPA: hypothetical protein VM536_20555, partial [Chloroflexia bacterium]|nr:hypothetical protein [Chloroflexia bacterium]
MSSRLRRWGTILLLAFSGLAFAPVAPVPAQTDSRTFPETGQTLSGEFWTYWQSHGGLTQQGFPISPPFLEQSELDSQLYVVQYCERAVLELHPRNPAPYNVLLSQVGTFRYREKYGETGAPNQTAVPNGQVFPQTGHTVGGGFLAYWQSHGGLAQQGYPISDEFLEISDLDGKPYTVQYFERAVFEYHPENAPPFDVLLTQLGTLRYQARYAAAPPRPISVLPPGIRDVLVRADATLNSLMALKQRAYNVATDGATTVVDIGTYLYQAPDQLYLKVVSPRPGRGDVVAEVVRKGPARWENLPGGAGWQQRPDSTPYRWPDYHLVDQAL